MKGILLAIMCVSLAFSGCSTPAVASKKIPAATLVQVPPGYYRVIGAVKHPGLIKCEGESESLMTIISEAGGIGDTDFHRKLKISVNYAGKTRLYKIERILAAQIEDPLVPCGASIRISARAVLTE